MYYRNHIGRFGTRKRVDKESLQNTTIHGHRTSYLRKENSSFSHIFFSIFFLKLFLNALINT